jgi:hypothetical protein
MTVGPAVSQNPSGQMVDRWVGTNLGSFAWNRFRHQTAWVSRSGRARTQQAGARNHHGARLQPAAGDKHRRDSRRERSSVPQELADVRRGVARHLCKESVRPANRRKSMPRTTRPSHFSCAAMATAHARGVCWEANGQLGGRNRSSWETSFHLISLMIFTHSLSILHEFMQGKAFFRL